MIQRIQSVYMLLAAAIMVIFYFFPIAVFSTNEFAFEFYNCHITHPENLEPPVALLPLAILPFISVLMSLVVIFMYKNRKLQRRLNKVNLLVLLLVVVAVVFYFFRIGNLLQGDVRYGFSGILPLIGMVLVFMANKAIKNDDNLVKAADRIR